MPQVDANGENWSRLISLNFRLCTMQRRKVLGVGGAEKGHTPFCLAPCLGRPLSNWSAPHPFLVLSLCMWSQRGFFFDWSFDEFFLPTLSLRCWQQARVMGSRDTGDKGENPRTRPSPQSFQNTPQTMSLESVNLLEPTPNQRELVDVSEGVWVDWEGVLLGVWVGYCVGI